LYGYQPGDGAASLPLRPMLEEQGYFVATTDPEHLYESLRQRPFEVVLMPGALRF
jgi:hypothetical protein